MKHTYLAKPFMLLILSAIVIGTGLFYQNRVAPVIADTEKEVASDFIQKVPKTTIITDRNGEVLYYLYKDENRIIVPSDKLPDSLKKAVVAAEDERFYLHNGFDLLSFFRALSANLQQKQIVSGGSTLTMQLVKNITGDSRRSWLRKAKEAYLATTLEQRYSKEQLLTLYLNLVPLGGTIGGAESASQLYFRKPATQMTLAESATLAALITSPNHYSTNPEDLETRRNYVLGRMVSTGKISQQEANTAISEKTVLLSTEIPFKAQHFVSEVVSELKKEYGDDIYTKGFNVTTTLDIASQMKAEQSIKDNLGVLRNNNADTVGMIVAEPKTGDILAMVGSADYFNNKNEGQVNIATAPLSYGSTLKPFIYALLMEKDHWSPGAIMWDVKTDFPIQGQRKPYTPYDYDRQFFGPMTIRQALANSRNVTAVKALQMVGLDNTLKRLEEFGVTSLGTNVSEYGPSLALGGGGIPLTQMTTIYTALANEGKSNPTHTIKKITDYNDKTISEYSPPNKQVLKPEVAYEVSEILQDNEARKRVFGPNSPLVIHGKTVAAKTGTAEDYRSALTIGYTPDVITAVIVANNNNAPLRAGAGGAMAAAPFFNAFMTRYLSDKPNNWYSRPSTITQTAFPTVIGKINDLTAPWQSPTDRFNKRIAEIDDPLWSRAIASSSTEKKKTEENKQIIRVETQSGIGGSESTNTQPPSAQPEPEQQADVSNRGVNDTNRGRGNDEKDD